jgi:hypothetical protein
VTAKLLSVSGHPTKFKNQEEEEKEEEEEEEVVQGQVHTLALAR